MLSKGSIAFFIALLTMNGCGTASLTPDGVDREQRRYEALVDDRTITILVKEDTTAGRVMRFVTLDDPLDEAPITAGIPLSHPDSLNIAFTADQGAQVNRRLVGTRNTDLSWQLSYTRGDAAPGAPLAFAEHPEPLIFERKVYGHNVTTYRVADRASNKPHPLDTVLQNIMCGGKTYEEYTAGGTGGSSLSVSIEFRNDDRVALAIEDSYYEEGMAHPQMGTRLFNYDLKMNREMKLANAVPRQHWSKLKAKVKQAFYAKYTDRSMRNNRFEFTENVAFLRNGIQFLYQPYQMGPFVMGYMDVIIPYSELEGMIDPRFVTHGRPRQ